MNVSDFLHSVITTESGFLCTPVSDGQHWVEAWYRWPQEEALVLDMVEETKHKLNVHFSAYLFGESTSDKQHALPSRTIQADLDNADINSLPIAPTVLVQTSPGRYHGYWILDKELPSALHEQLSRRLTYSIPLCDRSGWPIAKKLRIADTFNYKYEVPHEVQVVSSNDLPIAVSKFELLQPAPDSHDAHQAEEWLDLSEHGYHTGPYELLASIKQQIPAAVYNQYDSVQPDRSAALWALMCAAFRAGVSQEGVFWLAKHSVNNKFAHLKYGADRELAKDVLRAYDSVKAGIVNLRQFMNNARRNPGSRNEKMQYIMECTRNSMQESGTFLHSTDGRKWYMDRTTGRPIIVDVRSDQLDALLDIRYSLNPTEQEQRYVCASLTTYVSSLPDTATSTSLSYYNESAKALYVHTGRKDIIRVRASGIDAINNGEDGMIFPWVNNQELFTPNYDPFEDGVPWYDRLFRESVTNIVSMPKDQAVTLLRVWLLFLLFRQAAVSRPILSVHGAPGCLAGNTRIKVDRGKTGAQYVLLSDLYTGFNGLSRQGRPWNRTKPIRTLSLRNGVIEYGEIARVVYSGKKETCIVKLSNHSTIRATADHLFLTPTGFKKLGDLLVGHTVIVQGPPIKSEGHYVVHYKKTRGKYHPLGRISNRHKDTIYKDVMYARCVIEAHNNNLSIDEFLRIINTDPIKAATLKYIPPGMAIHHKDEDKSNDNYDNLEVLTKLEHDTHHGYSNLKNLGEYSGKYQCKEVKITSIEVHEVEDTYDITMKDEEYPNFIANDMVVHNSGKSTLFRKVYALLFGSNRSISAVTNSDDFDHSCATDAFVVLDNVDTFERWLPDRLALSASTSDITKRKLYTDADVITLRRQALIGLTAHAPKFGREDVADRLLIINLERLEKFEAEGAIIRRVLDNRSQLWGHILLDCQQVLRNPYPLLDVIPQFRIEDFARLGYWIAQGINQTESFVQALNTIKVGQHAFSLDEDSLIVSAILTFVQKSAHAKPGNYIALGTLWGYLETYSGDPVNFKKQYHHAQDLGKKLWVLQDSLKEVIRIDHQVDPVKGSRSWSLSKNATG